jgi:putative membrane protein
MYQKNNRANARWWVFAPVLVVVALAMVLIGVAFYFHSVGPEYDESGPRFGWWAGEPFLGFSWFLIIPILVLVFFAFRWFFWGRWGCGWYAETNPYSAFEILTRRFARGEITEERFEQMSRDLEQH